MSIILLLYLFVLSNANYVYNHVIKTNIASKSKLFDLMREKRYFDLYLNEVNANNIIFNPPINDRFLNNNQIIEYNCKPKLTNYPIKLPKMNIQQIWKVKNNKFEGNIITSLMDIMLEIDFLKKDNIEIHLKGTIQKKSFFVPNIALKYAILDYENICKKILKL